TCLFFCVFYDTAHPEFYTLSLHDALPILVAARIETEIAAQRAHVAEQGSGDELGGARDSVVVRSDGWVRTELREADAGPDHASRITHLASRQLPNPHQRDHRARLLLPPLHVGVEVRSAGHVRSRRTSVGLHSQGLRQRGRLQV